MKIDWSNYSKSTVAIAMDEAVGARPSRVAGDWHEFIYVPHPNDVSYGFWTLLGKCCDHHNQLQISKRFVPDFKGSWKRSLCVRPEIEQEVISKLNINLPSSEWDEPLIDCINDWLRLGIEMSVKRLQSHRRDLKEAAKYYRRSGSSRTDEYDGGDEERIG